MELIAGLIADTVSGARDLLAIWVTDSYNLTAQGTFYVDDLASLLSWLANDAVKAIAALLS